MLAGFLYPSGDYDACLDITRRLVEDAELRQRMGRQARAEVREVFQLNDICRHIRVLQCLLALTTHQ